MRSSVSALLSSPAPDTTMSFPDYEAGAQDHASLLLVAQSIGHQLQEDTFQGLVATLQERAAHIQVTDKQGAVRELRVRYLDRYPVENNEWGEFQAHRRVLGVLSVGSCSSHQELQELARLHQTAREKYSSTLYDSRCIVLCTNGSTDGNTNGDLGEEEENHEPNSLAVKEPDKPPPWLQAGQPYPARLLQYYGSHYQAELLSDIQDLVSSIFWILESKRVEAARETGSSEKLPLLCAPFERKDFVGLDLESRNNRKRLVGRLKKHLGDLSLQAGLLAEAWNYYQVAQDVLRPANDWLWLAAALEGVCACSVLVWEQELNTLRGLQGQEVVEKYREAVIHYGKYKHAGIVETEASIKAVRVLIKHSNFLLAAEFLQNIVFINLQMTDTEKIARFLALSHLYHQIGFHRKAAFFKRVAAMRCVAPQNPSPDWGACYHLMLGAVPGYSLPLASPGPPAQGWPALQVQLMQELVGTSRKMGSHQASTLHMTYLLQHLATVPSMRQDFAAQLSVLSSKACSPASPLPTVTGLVLQPVQLTSIPKVTAFTPLPPTRDLTPVALQPADSPSGPFLFTPIPSFGRGSARSSGRQGVRQALSWVVGEPAQVTLSLTNPLGVELRVPSMQLYTQGAEFRPAVTSLTLPANGEDIQVTLEGVPTEEGSLKILGYTHTVLGIKSICPLTELSFSDRDEWSVQIIPALPKVSVELSVLRGEDTWEPSPSLTFLYSGQSLSLRLVVTNTGTLPVSELTLATLPQETGAGSPGPQVSLDDSTLSSSLPLSPGQSVTVLGNVVGQGQQTGMPGSTVRPEDSVSLGGTPRQDQEHQEDRKWSLGSQGVTRGHTSLSSIISANSQGSRDMSQQQDQHQVQVCVSYSSRDPNVCWGRKALVSLSVAQLPSLQVSRWDVLPGGGDSCFLVLDLLNRTSQEMELQYADRKKILIEAGDTCRVPVPIAKCDFSQSLAWSHPEEGLNSFGEYIQGAVTLRWAILDGDDVKSGVASLSSIPWSEAMLPLLRKPPLVSRLMVGGREVKEGEEVAARVGQVTKLTISLTNHLGEAVSRPALRLRLETCEPGPGVGRVGVLGAPCVAGAQALLPSLHSLAPGEGVSHSTSLLPTTPGTFRIQVGARLEFRGREHEWTLTPPTLAVSV